MNIFDQKVIDELANEPDKTAFLIQGFLDGEICHSIASRDLRNHTVYFDGYKLDTLRGAFNMRCREDVDNFIKLLETTKYGLPITQ